MNHFHNYIKGLILLFALFFGMSTMQAKTSEMRSVNVNGTMRNYWLYVPDHVSGQAPLVLSLHGTGGHAADKSPFRTDVADQVGCIVAYPQGADMYFPLFHCTLPGWHSTGEYSDDIDFFKAIINDVAARFTIDRKRVYCCGFSNGGMMTYTAACVASDLFAAFASISGYPINEFHLHHSGTRPVPFLHIHGKADDFVRYRHMPVIVDNMVARDGCMPVPEKTRGNGYDKSVYKATEGGFPYVYYEIDNMGHSDFTTHTEDGSSAKTMWNFMSQYTLDSPCDTTLVWAPHIEAEGWNPAAHGFVMNSGTTLLAFGGEQNTAENQNVYHSLQLKGGHYRLTLTAKGSDKATVTLQIKSIVSGKTILNRTTGCGNIAVDFTANENWAEYKLTILSSSANTKLSNLSIHTTGATTAIHAVRQAATSYTQYVAINGSTVSRPAKGLVVKVNNGKATKVMI